MGISYSSLNPLYRVTHKKRDNIIINKFLFEEFGFEIKHYIQNVPIYDKNKS